MLLDSLGWLYYPICIGYLLFSFATTISAQKISSTRAQPNEIPLKDILHRKEFTWLCKYHYINNWIIYIEIFILIVYNINPGTLSNIISTTFLFFRTPSFIITTLPRPSREPKKNDYANTSTFKLVIKYITLQDRDPGYDNDLLFSGHVTFLAIFIYHIWLYSHFNLIIKLIITLINMISSLTITMNRRHYTICVWFAYIVSAFVYQNTHQWM
jgi:hypothetical protein